MTEIIERGLDREKFEEIWDTLRREVPECSEYTEVYPSKSTRMLRDGSDKRVALICECTTPPHRNTTNRETIERFVTYRGYKLLTALGKWS
jgi:hypothetical protein